nr:MAG TPA: hypothetical protein [Caudoviricetes sp.]
MIDNQQVKYKISIIFRIADRLPFLFPVLCGLGGGWSKNGSPAGPISGRWSVPHNQSPYNPIILLYLRYDKNITYYE